ncbi:MAG: serine hydrolase, partial [Planctomycetota bacterium]
ILSEESVKALTTRQTPSSMKESYGLGFAVGPDTAGHGGAHATSMNINFKTGRITVWMVQHAGFPADGAQARGAFEKAAALVK